MNHSAKESIAIGAVALVAASILTAIVSWSSPAAAMSYIPKACQLAEDRYVTIKSTTGQYLHEEDGGKLAGNETLGIHGVFVRKEASCGKTKMAHFENIHTGKFLDYDLQGHGFVSVDEKPRYAFSETRINKELISLTQHGYGLSMDWDGDVMPTKGNRKEDLVMIENAPELSTLITPMSDDVLLPVAAGLECAAKVVLAVDTSMSMHDVLDNVKQVLRDFINQAPQGQWQVSLITFADDVVEVFEPKA